MVEKDIEAQVKGLLEPVICSYLCGSLGLKVSGGGDDASEADTTTSEATTEVAARQGDTSIPGIDIQAVSAWFEKAAPFVGLLGIIFFWQHIVGIVVLVYLTSLIHKFNGVMRKEVALKEECSRWVCSALGAVAAIQVIGVLGLLYKQQLWTNLYLMPTTVDGLWSCLFKVAIVDALIRTLGFILKSMVLLLHPAQPEENNRRRSQVLAFLEQLMGMYRTVATVPCWLLYYDSLNMGAFWTSSMHGLYLWFKARNLFTELTSAWACGKALVRREFVYGQLVHPSDPQLMEGGGTCPICQDTMSMPIKLTCSHLFCDTCISTWLARERTCPMCRTIVRPAGTMGCTDGSTSLAPLVF
ncbi:g6615 [Coccomyxa elongata]